jgi:hypothetical protein
VKKLLAIAAVLAASFTCAGVASADPPILLGSNVTSWPATTALNPGYGNVYAWQYTGRAVGNSSKFSLYFADHSGTEQVGVYSDNSGQPGTLIAAVTYPASGLGWQVQSLSGVSVTLTTTYWLAIVQTSTTGTNTFPMDGNLDVGHGACLDPTPPDAELQGYWVLPKTWPALYSLNYGLCGIGEVVK